MVYNLILIFSSKSPSAIKPFQFNRLKVCTKPFPSDQFGETTHSQRIPKIGHFSGTITGTSDAMLRLCPTNR